MISTEALPGTKYLLLHQKSVLGPSPAHITLPILLWPTAERQACARPTESTCSNSEKPSAPPRRFSRLSGSESLPERISRESSALRDPSTALFKNHMLS